MSFQNPQFLWGLLFVLVPIIVHFFDFRRTKKVLFSNIQFLEHLNRDNTPRRRLKETLILLSRIFALSFLILAFCDPILRKSESKVFSEEVLYLDNSFSLSDDCGYDECLDNLKRLVIEYAESVGQGSIDYGSRYSKLFFSNPEEVVSHLSAMTYSKQLFMTNSGNPEPGSSQLNVVFSDFQDEILNALVALSKDSSEFLLVPVNRETMSNVFVDSVYLKAPFSVSNEQTELLVKVRNSGTTRSEDVLIKLLSNNQQISSVAVSLEPDEITEVEFLIQGRNQKELVIQLEDGSTNFDNRFYFSLPPLMKPSISVLDIDANKNLEAVFSNSDFFDFSYFTRENVNFQSLLNSDLLVINGFNQLPEWLDLDKIQSDVVIFPGSNIDLEGYSSSMGFRISESDDSTFNSILIKDFENPFYDGIFDNLSDRVSLPGASVKYQSSGKYVTLLQTYGELLVRYENQGRSVYWFNTPLIDRFTNFQNHAIFLPIMYRIAEESASSNDPLFYRLSPKPFPVGVKQERAEVMKLVGKSQEFIPEIYPNQNNMVIELPDELNEPGHFYLLNGSDTLLTLALNYEKKESLLNFKGAEDLRRIFAGYPNVRVLDPSASGSLEASLRTLDKGISLWKYALILVLMFLIGETAIHRSK